MKTFNSFVFFCAILLFFFVGTVHTCTAVSQNKANVPLLCLSVHSVQGQWNFNHVTYNKEISMFSHSFLLSACPPRPGPCVSLVMDVVVYSVLKLYLFTTLSNWFLCTLFIMNVFPLTSRRVTFVPLRRPQGDHKVPRDSALLSYDLYKSLFCNVCAASFI